MPPLYLQLTLNSPSVGVGDETVMSLTKIASFLKSIDEMLKLARVHWARIVAAFTVPGNRCRFDHFWWKTRLAGKAQKKNGPMGGWDRFYVTARHSGRNVTRSDLEQRWHQGRSDATASTGVLGRRNERPISE